MTKAHAKVSCFVKQGQELDKGPYSHVLQAIKGNTLEGSRGPAGRKASLPHHGRTSLPGSRACLRG